MVMTFDSPGSSESVYAYAYANSIRPPVYDLSEASHFTM
jgi:hypothetical protein